MIQPSEKRESVLTTKYSPEVMVCTIEQNLAKLTSICFKLPTKERSVTFEQFKTNFNWSHLKFAILPLQITITKRK